MKLLFIILAIVTCLQLANSCCCSFTSYNSIGLGDNCGCNVFNCNCKTINGYCIKKIGLGQCISTQGIHNHEELCGWHMTGPTDLDLFDRFDTNKDGYINIEEARARASLNVTLDAFNEVDTNRDGLIQAAEFDSSLDNYPYANDEENENENTEMIKRLFTMMEKFTERMESYESQL
eukprot:GFUD01043884.1.p1 GENE.GFUD01043884.1~~GFUD01043884.1.p1  ORF type:complete len:177 (+),score=39.81 GFUD01043884.1:92-622(+)